ncbi:hypothetical protein Dda3937_04414 [Dickeya dadantii 3937]|uniref:Uncharacterized protein n=1 Tax=Dickeya dadantii (strain 3937) TaxID=198628 RepID=E0SIY7_DICD3|nr:hypothetical protein Dda3937_04414 [Dickeya dadantii 3937]
MISSISPTFGAPCPGNINISPATITLRAKTIQRRAAPDSEKFCTPGFTPDGVWFYYQNFPLSDTLSAHCTGGKKDVIVSTGATARITGKSPGFSGGHH